MPPAAPGRVELIRPACSAKSRDNGFYETSIRDNTEKKRRGPLPTGKGELLGVRVQPRLLAALDKWIAQQADGPSRPEAIRRLLEQALARSLDRSPRKQRKAQKASELANHVADRIVDKSMPPEEQDRRKRALIKGPKEFRDIREDQPKTKS
jgi:hypothetical protein